MNQCKLQISNKRTGHGFTRKPCDSLTIVFVFITYESTTLLEVGEGSQRDFPERLTGQEDLQKWKWKWCPEWEPELDGFKGIDNVVRR